MKKSETATRQVCETMARNAPRITEETTMVDALRLLEETSAPVCVLDEDGNVVGMIGEDDIRAFVEAMRTVAHIMNRNFLPVGEDARVSEIAELFESDADLSALPVYGLDGTLVGAISREQVERADQPSVASDVRAKASGTVRRPDRPTATTRFRRTLTHFRDRAAAVRRERAAAEVRS